MDTTGSVVHGTLRPDGALQLDQVPAVAPGRVQVIVQPLPTLPADDPFWQRMQAMWDRQLAARTTPRSAADIELESRIARDEWEERSTALEAQQGRRS